MFLNLYFIFLYHLSVALHLVEEELYTYVWMDENSYRKNKHKNTK